MKVTLVESQPVVLHTFSPKLVDFTNHIFKDTNINLITNSRIVEVDNTHASILTRKIIQPPLCHMGCLYGQQVILLEILSCV